MSCLYIAEVGTLRVSGGEGAFASWHDDLCRVLRRLAEEREKQAALERDDESWPARDWLTSGVTRERPSMCEHNQRGRDFALIRKDIESLGGKSSFRLA